MKQRVLLTVAVAAFAASGYVVFAQACDKDKAAVAKTASRPSSYLVSNDGSCSAKQRAAMASMSGQCAAKGTSASVASMEHCAGKGASATTASMEQCAAKGASATVAAGGDCCAAKGAKSAKGAKASSFAVAGSGGQCSGKGMAQTADASNHHDCDACADMAACADQLRSTGTMTQVVPLKNGVMYVYTADSPSRVRAVQSAVAHRSERLSAMTVSGDKAKLCPECRNIRGAIASGKLSRETVNIDGGCLTLMTSNDPGMVGRLRTMAGLTTARNIKS